MLAVFRCSWAWTPTSCKAERQDWRDFIIVPLEGLYHRAAELRRHLGALSSRGHFCGNMLGTKKVKDTLIDNVEDADDHWTNELPIF